MKLTPTMDKGLRAMAWRAERRHGTTQAIPNNNTGRALEKRGLVAVVDREFYVYYRITDAGYAYLRDNPK